MKTLKKIKLELVETNLIPQVHKMEFGKFYYSKEYNITNHFCPCGCGQQTPLYISKDYWDLKITNNKITINPSILQRAGCKTHYVIKDGVANII